MPKFLIAVTDRNTGETLYGRITRDNGLRYSDGSHFMRQPGERHRAGFYDAAKGTPLDGYDALNHLLDIAEKMSGGRTWIENPRIVLAPERDA